MSDGTRLDLGSGGDLICTEDCSRASGKIPVSKMVLGTTDADGGNISKTNPMPVGGNEAADGSGTEHRLVVNSSGQLSVVIASGTITIPTGAATAAKQDTGNTSLASIDGKIPALGQALAAGSVPVVLTAAQLTTLTPVLPAALGANGGLKIEGVASGTVVPVSDGGGSLTVDGSVSVSGLVPGVSSTSLGKSEDAAAADGDTGVMALAVRKDTAATTVGADGDYHPLEVDANGRLWCSAKIDTALPAGTAAIGKLAANDGVDIGDVTINNASGAAAVNVQDGGNSLTVDNGGTFVVQENGTQVQADDAAFTPGTSKVLMAGFTADETATDSVDEGDGGAARMTLDRRQIVVPQAHTAGGATPYTYPSAGAANQDSTVVKNGAGQVYTASGFNVATTPRYLKLYDKATGPTSADTPVHVVLLPAGTLGAGAVLTLPVGLVFANGISFRITTGMAHSDANAASTGDCIINLGYK